MAKTTPRKQSTKGKAIAKQMASINTRTLKPATGTPAAKAMGRGNQCGGLRGKK